MTTTSRIFFTTAGATSIASPYLTNVVILRVCRQGLGFNTITTGTPGNREARYVTGSGQLIFADPFTGIDNPAAPVYEGEHIYVRFKY